MKRLIAMLCCIFLLYGCSPSGERIKEPVRFYYPRSEIIWFDQEGVISSEMREASGHREDLTYLLKLYLLGPTDETLTSALPDNAQLLGTAHSTNSIIIHLSDLDDVMTDAEFSLAGACLAMTCFDLTDTRIITVDSGERAITLTRESIHLYDSSTQREDTDQ